MAASLNTIRIVQGLGLLGAAWTAGSIASISLVTVPALLQSKAEDGVDSTTLARQWRSVYDHGKARAPPIAALTAAAFGYLAWTARQLVSTTPMLLFAAGAVVTVGIVPFTVVVMSSTNDALSGHGAWSRRGEKDSVVGKLDDRRIDELLVRWGRLNLVRSLLPLLGSVLAFVAA